MDENVIIFFALNKIIELNDKLNKIIFKFV